MTPIPSVEPVRRRMPPDPRALLPGMVGESLALRETLSRARSALRRRPGILVLQGEPGTGRTRLARLLHQMDRTRSGPLLVLDCASLPASEAAVELQGAPTTGRPGLLELSRGGILILDDAHQMSHELVRGLLQAREEAGGAAAGEDFPVVVATAALPAPTPGPGPSDDMGALSEAEAATPLDVLLERTGAGALILPPLRDRDGDIGLLARHFLEEWGRERGEEAPRMDGPARAALEAHTWPGNVRELRQVVRQAAELAPGRQIREEHLRVRTRGTRGLDPEAGEAPGMILIPARGKAWSEIEAEAVRATLLLTEGNRSQASRILGISRPTLARKIRKYALEGAEGG